MKDNAERNFFIVQKLKKNIVHSLQDDVSYARIRSRISSDKNFNE